MSMGDLRLRILAEARNILEKEGGSYSERESILKLLDILTATLEKYPPALTTVSRSSRVS